MPSVCLHARLPSSILVVSVPICAQDMKQANDLGEKMKTMIFQLIDTYMFFDKIGEVDQTHIDSLAAFDDNIDLK